MKANQAYISQSYDKFSIKFKALLEQANLSDSTIFSNSIDVNKIEDSLILEHYEYFINNYNFNYHQAQGLEKNDIIKRSINESFFQNNFNQVLDAVIMEGTVSLNSQILLENTAERFKLDLSKIGVSYLKADQQSQAPQAIEENVFGFGAGLSASALGVAALPAIGISMLTSFALALLMPAKNMNDLAQDIGKLGGVVGRALTGSFNAWQTGFTPALGQSHENIIKFDNIDADPKVKELFQKIQKIHINEATAQKGLTSLVAECVHQNSNILTIVDVPNSGFLDGIFSPKNYNVLKLIIKAMIGKSETGGEEYDTLLRFRKCLSNKLVDVYKLLLISNLQSKKDYSRILTVVTKANSDRPEQLINFLPSETEEDQQLREAILSLIMFRLHLTNLSKQLNSGFFEVDKEAGKFLDQKLRTVDLEVEQYLRLNRSKFPQPFEGKPMDRKPSLTKRSILSKYSLPN